MSPITPSQLVRMARCEVAGRTFGLDMAAIVGIQPSEVVRVPECRLPLGLLVSPECEILTCPISGTTVSPTRIGVAPSAIRAVFQVAQRTLLFPRFSAHSVTV